MVRTEACNALLQEGGVYTHAPRQVINGTFTLLHHLRVKSNFTRKTRHTFWELELVPGATMSGGGVSGCSSQKAAMG